MRLYTWNTEYGTAMVLAWTAIEARELVVDNAGLLEDYYLWVEDRNSINSAADWRFFDALHSEPTEYASPIAFMVKTNE